MVCGECIASNAGLAGSYAARLAPGTEYTGRAHIAFIPGGYPGEQRLRVEDLSIGWNQGF